MQLNASLFVVQGISQFETHFEHFHFYAKKNKLIND